MRSLKPTQTTECITGHRIPASRRKLRARAPLRNFCGTCSARRPRIDRPPVDHAQMLLEDVQNCLRIALTTTIVEEYGLFAASSQRMPPSERAFAAQLAFRLRHIFEDHWDVDVDYNSWPTPGERRTRSRVLEIPSTAAGPR